MTDSPSPLPVSESPPAAVPAPAPRWLRWLLLVALAGYGVFLSVHMTTVAGGADSSGYMNSGKLFYEGTIRTPLRVPAEFSVVPLERRHFSPAGYDIYPPSPDLAAVYPSGMPLHLALFARLLGWTAGPFVLQLAAALAALWLCYLAGRELGLDALLSAGGAAVLAAFPVFIYSSYQTLSDTLATTWTLAAVVCALRARRGPGWAIACGASLAVAVLVRPTNVLLAPALVLLLGFDLRTLVRFVAGGLPGAVFLGLYNHHAYGGAFRSGYGDIFAAFGREYFGMTMVHFAKWLALFLPSVLLALPLAACTHAATRTRAAAGLGVLAATIVVFYAFCSFSHDAWTYLRYILPAVPALILLGLLGVEALARHLAPRWPRIFRPAAAAVLVLWAGASSAYAIKTEHVLYVPLYERAYYDAAQLLRRHAPPEALVVCCNFSGTVYHYTPNPTLLFDSVSAEAFARYRELARAAGRPIYAAVFDIEEQQALRENCPGPWTRVASAGNIGLWKLE